MNVIQFDSTISLELLREVFKRIKEDYPDMEVIAVPKGINFMADIDAETLFQFIDNISVALLKIKEERPEEYAEAERNRIANIRDKQWEEALRRQNETYHKRNCKNNNV